MNTQLIKDSAGVTQFVVLPVAEYERLAQLDDEQFVEIPYKSDKYDDVTIPHAVVSVMIEKQVSLLAAWRIYRALTQAQVFEVTGISQASLSQMEQQGKTVQLKTRKKLAKIYDCEPEQLID